jgi:hypothetical protein
MGLRRDLRHQPQRVGALALYQEVNSSSFAPNNNSHNALAKAAIVWVDLVRIISVGY